MTITVEQINLDTLPTNEAAAIRAAEKEAEDFYGAIDAENLENERIKALRKICSVIVLNPFSAREFITQPSEDTNLFTDAEKANLVLAVENVLSENTRGALRTYDLTRGANDLFLSLRNGYQGHVTTAQLIQRIHPAKQTAKQAVKKPLFRRLLGA